MFFIYPNQLYPHPPPIPLTTHIYIIEDPLYFYDKERPFKYHKAKLVYMVTCMRKYMSFLHSKGFTNISYVQFDETPIFYKRLLDKHHPSSLSLYDPTDHLLLSRLAPYKPKILPSPSFLLDLEYLKKYHDKHPGRTLHSHFYDFVREKIHILEGVKSTDAFNRKPLPTSYIPSTFAISYVDPVLENAKIYISTHPLFKNNHGSLDNVSIWANDHASAKKALKTFISKRLDNYGFFQDAIHDKDPFVYHSCLSPLINIGLLTPQQIIKEVMSHKTKINNLEGFIRQIIGWREYMRYLYCFRYKEIIKSNTLSLTKLLPMPSAWYNGTTGISPIDSEIKKVLNYGYAHHIIRLMMFLNFFILNGVDAKYIYVWFMEMIAMDAYEWVMIPNIYCMGYYYPLAMSRPYISSSNYILNMSNYKKGPWCDKWDTLFHTFIQKHYDKLPMYHRNIQKKV